MITGIGPRYCPSIEDKLRTFADKDSHQLFLEPEGRATNEYYLQGFSSSLPLEIQMEALRQIDGFANVKVFRPAYAVEYDYFDPTLLQPSLESKVVENLYLAGQVNGTTGYEEAAAQGLMAGINAHLKCSGADPFVLKRDQAYIGVLIDDLITKGVDEPYRMFTSRAEYRILLRQDDADLRLTPLSYSLGLADKSRYDYTMKKYESAFSLSEAIGEISLKPETVNPYLESVGSATVDSRKRITDLVSRPQVSLSKILDLVPRGTFKQKSVDLSDVLECQCDFSSDEKYLEQISYSDFRSYSSDRGTKRDSFDDALLVLKDNTGYPVSSLDGRDMSRRLKSNYRNDVVQSSEIAIKYSGYIDRERKIADKILRLESLIIPDGFDFDKVVSLSIECRQKLKKYSPKTIAQASRISGVSPADISVLLVYFGR